MKKLFIVLVTTLSLSACKNSDKEFDASGTFEAEETMISAEATGTIKQFDVEEGQMLKAGQSLGYIDSLQLFLKKKQLLAQINAVVSKRPDVNTQLAALQTQLHQAEKDRDRMDRLVKANAATQKQLDDANSQVSVISKQIEAQQSTLSITSTGIGKETLPLQVQIEQVEDQLAHCKISNPVNGTVLAKYAMVNEMAMQGKPLYKIADLSTLILKAYITGTQFANLRIGQKVKVFVDKNEKEYRQIEGTVEWINTKAEFTPKTIQTKDERANLVYGVKIRVENEGSLKIGMYGEVKF